MINSRGPHRASTLIFPTEWPVKWGLHIRLHIGERADSKGEGRGSDGKGQREEKVPGALKPDLAQQVHSSWPLPKVSWS